MSTTELDQLRAALIADGWGDEATINAMPDEQVRELAATLSLEMQATTAVAQPKLADVEVEIMHGQAMFRFPGSENPVPDFSAVILAVRKHMAWYEKSYVKGSKDAPDCSSADGITASRVMETREINGVKRRCFGRCDLCFYGQFESSRNGSNAKDCAESRVLILKTEDRELPLILRAPSKSIQGINSYLVNIANQKLPMSGVRTRFSLYHEPDGDNFSVLSLTLDGDKAAARLPAQDLLRMSRMKAEAPFLALNTMKALPQVEDAEPDQQAGNGVVTSTTKADSPHSTGVAPAGDSLPF